MYLPRHFAEDDPAALQALVAACPLATLVHHGPAGLTADHVPMLLERSGSAHGVLRGHVARANPVWRQAAGQQVLAVFQGADGYVSPNWYPSKSRDGRAVPTWNYAVVHAHGVLRAIDDEAWLRDFVSRLTVTHESPRPAPWAVDDAPPDYLAAMLRGIVGIEIELTSLVGKFKLSQNRDAADRAGVADGLVADGRTALAAAVNDAAPPPRAPAA